jgi:penicillin amidase
MIVVWESLLISQAPNYSGTKLVKGIGSEVNVYRDESGVPHIIAKDAKSAYFALGYVVAQDRLFQMEIIRRLSQGRLAEILGKDLLPVDKMFRTLLLTEWAMDYSNSQEKISPEAWTNLDHYLLGVNSFLEEGNLPMEYTILNIPVQKFERKDALTSLAYMGFSFAEGIKTDSLYSILSEKFPDRKIEDLFPRYDFEKGSSIQEDQPIPPLLYYQDDKGNK